MTLPSKHVLLWIAAAGLLGFLAARRGRYRSNPIELVEIGDGDDLEWSDESWNEATEEAAQHGRSDVSVVRQMAAGS